MGGPVGQPLQSASLPLRLRRHGPTFIGVEPIKRLTVSDPDKATVQDEAIASAETWPERHIARYRALDGAFGGRYILADLFKETFAAYAASRESRANYNVAVHNASAVLSAELYRRVLAEPDARTRAMFLTGIPGAGKTTSVLVQGGIAPDTRLVFEGQMWRPESTFPKLQQAIDAGVDPVIVVVHPRPEYALRNTFKRIDEIGRGASIETMANIQGGLPDGLAAVRERFGNQVQLIVHDARDPAHRRKLVGWDNLDVLRSEGTREQIEQRLVSEFEQAERDGVAGLEHRRQALGDRSPDARRVDRRVASEDGRARQERDSPARDRAQAFLTLGRGDAIARHPELVTAYEALDGIRQQMIEAGYTQAGQDAAMTRLHMSSTRSN